MNFVTDVPLKQHRKKVIKGGIDSLCYYIISVKTKNQSDSSRICSLSVTDPNRDPESQSKSTSGPLVRYIIFSEQAFPPLSGLRNNYHHYLSATLSIFSNAPYIFSGFFTFPRCSFLVHLIEVNSLVPLLFPECCISPRGSFKQSAISRVRIIE